VVWIWRISRNIFLMVLSSCDINQVRVNKIRKKKFITVRRWEREMSYSCNLDNWLPSQAMSKKHIIEGPFLRGGMRKKWMIN
jgi:hypothetical protein